MAARTGNHALRDVWCCISKIFHLKLNHNSLPSINSISGLSNTNPREDKILQSEKHSSLTKQKKLQNEIEKPGFRTPSIKGFASEDIISSLPPLDNAIYSNSGSANDADSSMSFEEPIGAMSDKVRHVMRHVPQSVAILTTSRNLYSRDQTTEYDRVESKAIGMTLSSVNTVTLEPQPVISFNIKKPSHTLDAVRHHGHFLIHFPSCSKAGACLSNSFSRGFLQSRDLQSMSFRKSTPIPVLNIKGQEIFLPALFSPAYPISYVLKCEVYTNNGLIDVSDHVIVLGKVQKTWSTNESSMQSTSKILCLGYIDGSYCSISKYFPW